MFVCNFCSGKAGGSCRVWCGMTSRHVLLALSGAMLLAGATFIIAGAFGF